MLILHFYISFEEKHVGGLYSFCYCSHLVYVAARATICPSAWHILGMIPPHMSSGSPYTRGLSCLREKKSYIRMAWIGSQCTTKIARVTLAFLGVKNG